jgi:hypothetical protein
LKNLIPAAIGIPQTQQNVGSEPGSRSTRHPASAVDRAAGPAIAVIVLRQGVAPAQHATTAEEPQIKPSRDIVPVASPL